MCDMIVSHTCTKQALALRGRDSIMWLQEVLAVDLMEPKRWTVPSGLIVT